MMKKPDKNATKITPPSVPFNDELFALSYPKLYWFLTSQKYADGAPRQTGSVSLFTIQGCLRGSMNDKDNERVSFVEADTFDELVALMDARVCDDSTEWKASARRPPY